MAKPECNRPAGAPLAWSANLCTLAGKLVGIANIPLSPIPGTPSLKFCFILILASHAWVHSDHLRGGQWGSHGESIVALDGIARGSCANVINNHRTKKFFSLWVLARRIRGSYRIPLISFSALTARGSGCGEPGEPSLVARSWCCRRGERVWVCSYFP